MKSIRLPVLAGMLLALVLSAMPSTAENPFHLNNRLRLGYDDNIYQEGKGEDRDPNSSFRIIEEIEVLLALNMERTYLGLRYRPSLIWYEDRTPDDFDFLNDLDFNFTHDFSPNLSLSLNDVLSAGQLPELQDEGYVVRQNDDNYLNSAVATLAYNIRPETRVDLSGRYIMLVYNENSPSKENNDYYSWVGGLTLRQQLASRSTILGDVRYQTLVYNEAPEIDNRDADTIFGGLGLEQNFNPQLIGSLRGGVQSRQYDNEAYDDNVQPYGEISTTYMPSPATRLTAAGSYSIYESDVDSYLSQNRAYASLSFTHDFTAKLNFYVSSAFALGMYEADYALENDLSDADETSYLVSARLSYRLNRINWIETGWQYVKLDTDVENRESYTRNRFDVGWKIQLF